MPPKKKTGGFSVTAVAQLASAIRSKKPEVYGVKGAKTGQPGFKKGGWQAAQRLARRRLTIEYNMSLSPAEKEAAVKKANAKTPSYAEVKASVKDDATRAAVFGEDKKRVSVVANAAKAAWGGIKAALKPVVGSLST